jgi:hypothetical protein
MPKRAQRLASVCALTASLFHTAIEPSFAERTAYRLNLPDAAYAVEDCSVYRLSGGKSELVATFPHPIDEIRNSHSPLNIFHQTRRIYDCSLSTAIVNGDTIWFALDGNDWDKSLLGGIGFFNTATGQIGSAHPPALVPCSIDELRISSRTLYATTYHQGDIGRGYCSGIISINLDNGAIASYAQTEPVENLPKILTEIISSIPSQYAPQKETPFIPGPFSPDNSNLEEHMIAALKKELAIKEAIQAKAKLARESRCEMSEKTGSCSSNSVRFHFTSLGNTPRTIAVISVPGSQIELCPWGNKPVGAKHNCVNPKKGMMWYFEDHNHFTKITLEDQKTRYIYPKNGKDGERVFKSLNFLLQEYTYPPVETPERSAGLVIDRDELIAKSGLPAELNELLSNLVLKEEIDHKAALTKLDQISSEEKEKLLAALILALRADEYSVRRRVWFALAELGEIAAPSLKAELTSPSELAQEGAIVAIRMIGFPYTAEIIPELINALKNAKGEVYTAARYTLEKSGPDALNPLIGLFNESEDAELKVEIIKIIASLKLSFAGTFLRGIALNEENNSDLRMAAAKALLYVDKTIPATEETLPIFMLALRDRSGIQDSEEERLVAAGAIAVPSLIAVLSGERATYRAIGILERIGPAAKAAVPRLKELVGNPTASEAAIEALVNMGENPGKAAVPMLAAKIQIPCAYDDPGCNTWAIQLLSRMRGDARPAIPALKNILYDYVHGMYAASALAKIAPELKDEYFEILVRALDNEVYIKDSSVGGMKWMSTGNWINHAVIMDAISEFGPGAKEAAPKIERFLSSGEPYEKEAAEKALERINGKDLAPSTAHPSKALQEEFAANEKDILDILAKIRSVPDNSIPLENDALAIIQKVELMAKAGHQGGYDILNNYFQECSWRRPDAQLYEYILQHLYYSDAILPTVILGLEKLATPDIYRGCGYFDMTYETTQPRRYSPTYANLIIKAMARIDLPDYAYKPCEQALKSQVLDPETRQDFIKRSYPALSANEKLLADKILQ